MCGGEEVTVVQRRVGYADEDVSVWVGGLGNREGGESEGGADVRGEEVGGWCCRGRRGSDGVGGGCIGDGLCGNHCDGCPTD